MIVELIIKKKIESYDLYHVTAVPCDQTTADLVQEKVSESEDVNSSKYTKSSLIYGNYNIA